LIIQRPRKHNIPGLPEYFTESPQVNDVFVPTAEAAFIAGVTDRDMNRAIDEHILPDSLIRSDDGRRFARLGAALAGFYFISEDVYAAGLRRKVLEEVTRRVSTGKDAESLLALRPNSIRGIDWRVRIPSASIGPILVDVGASVTGASDRVALIDKAHSLVTTDPEILGGIPIFSGTRIPVEIIFASLSRMDRSRVLTAYPSLTDEHLNAAQVYADIHPRRGRPSKTPTFPSSWKLKSTRRIVGHDEQK
jgi:uncharacterized protein (DUF433 family)